MELMALCEKRMCINQQGNSESLTLIVTSTAAIMSKCFSVTFLWARLNAEITLSFG